MNDETEPSNEKRNQNGKNRKKNKQLEANSIKSSNPTKQKRKL